MTALAHNSPSESLAGRLASSRHCIFQSGGCWFSMPAVTIREVLVAPKTVRLPESPSWLMGIAHVQSEFIPVVSLERLLNQSSYTTGWQEERLLVMAGSPVWALLVTQVLSLTDIEATLSPDNHSHFGRSSCTVGTFMLGDRIASVLEPHRILQQLQQGLRDCWKVNSPNSWSNCCNDPTTDGNHPPLAN